MSGFRAEARQGGVLIGAQMATGVLTVLYSALVGRTLGAAESADFFAALFLVFGLATVASSVNGAVTRYVSFHLSREGGDAITGLGARLVRRIGGPGVLVVGAGILFARPVAEALGVGAPGPAAAAVAAGVVALMVNVPRGVLRGGHLFRSLSINLVAEAGLRLAFGAALLSLSASATSALLAYPLALGAAVAIGSMQARSGLGGVGPSAAGAPDVAQDPGAAPPGPVPVPTGPAPAPTAGGEREVWAWFWPLLGFSGVSAAFANADVLLVARYFPETGEGGPYGAAATLARLFAALVIPFQMLLLPLLTARHARGAAVTAPLLRITGLFIALSFPALVAFGLFGGAILGAVYGPGFGSAVPVLVPLSLAVIVGAVSALVGQAFVSMGDFRFLVPYGLGFVLELGAVAMWHESPLEIVKAVLVVKGITLVALSLQLAIGLRRSGSTVPASGVTQGGNP